jgi:rhodanese-related sulfurtransferase
MQRQHFVSPAAAGHKRSTTNRQSIQRRIEDMSQQDLPAEIDVKSVKQLLDQGEQLTLLDVREPSEIATAAINGTVRIPMQQIPTRVAELTPQKNERIVVHCHHGGRSARVQAWLQQQGFTQVQNMTGGIDAWSEQVDSSVPRYERNRNRAVGNLGSRRVFIDEATFCA